MWKATPRLLVIARAGCFVVNETRCRWPMVALGKTWCDTTSEIRGCEFTYETVMRLCIAKAERRLRYACDVKVFVDYSCAVSGEMSSEG